MEHKCYSQNTMSDVYISSGKYTVAYGMYDMRLH